MAPRLDYVPRLDERNKAHRVGIAAAATTAVYWTPGSPVLNQQAEGACVGFGVTAEYMASPVRGKGNNELARAVYHRCLQIDEFEGEADSGTSVRAGMLVGRERGWWSGFQWAMNMDELNAAVRLGPVVIGVEWRADMYEAPGGILRATGDVVGGHCILVTGYQPMHPRLRAPAYRLRNSWGPDFGAHGSAYVSAADLKSVLFDSGGEAAVPIGRHL